MRLRKKILLILFFSFQTLFPVTLVYNLRVRRVFNVEPLLERMNNRKIFTALPIFFARKSHIINERTGVDVKEKRRAGGSLFNFRYIPNKNWWMELTTGLETDHGKFRGTDTFKASRTGFDDIVLAAGYRHFFKEKVQLVGYGIAGFPTRRKVTLEDRFTPFVGTRFYNVGVGAEASYSFISCLLRSFSAIVQGRFIHAFNRKWTPILPENAEIQPGNFSDILFVLQFRERRTIFETGYDATIFSHQALVFPQETITTPTFVRHSWYATVSHGVFEGPFGKPFIFGVGCNVSTSKQFDATTFTSWVYGSLVF